MNFPFGINPSSLHDYDAPTFSLETAAFSLQDFFARMADYLWNISTPQSGAATSSSTNAQGAAHRDYGWNHDRPNEFCAHALCVPSLPPLADEFKATKKCQKNSLTTRFFNHSNRSIVPPIIILE